MGRLTIRTENGAALKLDNPQNKAEARKQLHDKYLIAVEKLAHYEELEEQLIESAEIDIDSMVGEFMHDYKVKKENRLIELPCAAGEIVWIARDGVPVQESIFYLQSDILCLVEDGYIFGTTKEEAEAKLEELKGE